MVWSARSLNRNVDYIVVKHPLRGINTTINGVKFRESYAVVEKNSKTYHHLKRMPQLRAAKEFPLVFLDELPFIITPLEVKTVYGADVYQHFVKAREEKIEQLREIEKVVQEEEHIAEEAKCAFRTKTGELCKNKALIESPSSYCMKHLIFDPELKLELPKYMSRKDRRELTKRTLTKLKSNS
jgi:hypothetical protein